jgi:hypothetical protein
MTFFMHDSSSKEISSNSEVKINANIMLVFHATCNFHIEVGVHLLSYRSFWTQRDKGKGTHPVMVCIYR